MKQTESKLYTFWLTILFLTLSCSSTNKTNSIDENVVANTFNNTSELLNNSYLLKINDAGWELPDLTKYEIDEKQTKLNIKSPKPVILNRYSPKGDQLLNTSRLGKMRVLSVREFEIEERKFCYIITVDKPASKDSNISNVLVSTNLVYYDLDGDNKFETSDSKFTEFPTIFPKWLE